MDQFIEFLGNHYMLTTAWVVLFAMLVMSWISAATSAIKIVSTHDLTMIVNRADGQVVDIRKQIEFNKGHITDAINLPLEKITAGKLGALEKHKQNPIVVVCNAGMSAQTAAKSLNKAGFEKVVVLKGGMQTWLSENLPVVKK